MEFEQLKENHRALLRKIYSQESFTINFICSGNIIRSPYAELLFEKLIQDSNVLHQKIRVESGGVKYKNTRISEESTLMLLKDGVSQDRINKFSPRFIRDYPKMFEKSDLILVMEKNHLRYLPDRDQKRSYLFLDFIYGKSIGNVPDPYFDPPFDRAYKMIKEALITLLDRILEL